MQVDVDMWEEVEKVQLVSVCFAEKRIVWVIGEVIAGLLPRHLSLVLRDLTPADLAVEVVRSDLKISDALSRFQNLQGVDHPS